ncbi:MAG: VacJ family lipoprotein [Rhodospirillales bacterium]|nr:VacJ family lipoprotein [Rhodospirillales bacterium]
MIDLRKSFSVHSLVLCAAISVGVALVSPQPARADVEQMAAVAFVGEPGDGAIAEEASQIAAATAVDDGDDVNDPLEPLNRLIFDFNEFFNKAVLYPATSIYQIFLPPQLRNAIGNMIDNLSTPVILANDILQGEGERALRTTQRFFINSTLGIGGMMDVAEDMGISEHDEDFGQTLAVWGMGEGFYLVLPLYGPSNPRDAIGKLLVDGYFDPLGQYLSNTGQDEASMARLGVGGVDEYGGVMDELEQIKKTSVDYYAAIRSMYRQKRTAEIGNGDAVELPPIPDLGFDFDPSNPDDMGTGSASSPSATPKLEDDQISAAEE